MLYLDKVSKQYSGGGKGARVVKAVDGVSCELMEDEIFALIGESGSGKSTLAELIVGLQQPTSGSIVWRERQTPATQMVFQNPDRSMNPYWKVRDIVAEPLRLSGYPKQAAWLAAEELLAKVKLSSEYMDRLPAQCSGGQKQRIAIARALSMSPRLLVADEITSALDPMIEAEIMALLLELKRAEGMSILYITHRIETIAHFADRVAVMRSGTIQEIGDTAAVFHRPSSAYTRELIQASSYDRTPS